MKGLNFRQIVQHRFCPWPLCDFFLEILFHCLQNCFPENLKTLLVGVLFWKTFWKTQVDSKPRMSSYTDGDL